MRGPLLLGAARPLLAPAEKEYADMLTTREAWMMRPWRTRPVYDAAPYGRNAQAWTVAYVTLDDGVFRVRCVAYASTSDEKTAYDAVYSFLLRSVPKYASMPVQEYGTMHNLPKRPYQDAEAFRIMSLTVTRGQT